MDRILLKLRKQVKDRMAAFKANFDEKKAERRLADKTIKE